MPNLNAALGCAQLERLPDYVKKKRVLSKQYKSHFTQSCLADYIDEPDLSSANFWLNAIMLPTKKDRDVFLEQTNQAGIMTRPAWKPLHLNPLFSGNNGHMPNTMAIANSLVNIPSSAV